MKDFDKWLDSLTEDLQPEEEGKTSWPQAPLAPWHEEVIRELRKTVDAEFKPNYLMIFGEQDEVLAEFSGDFPAAKNGASNIEMPILKTGVACKYRIRIRDIVIARELDYPQAVQKDDTAVFQFRTTHT